MLRARGESIRGARLAVSAFLATLCLGGPGQAETALLEASRDATLIEQVAGALANGAGPAFFVGRTSQGQGSVRRGVLAFDLAGGVPAGAWVTGVELRLELTPSNVGVADVALHRLLRRWSEGPSVASGGGGALAQPGDTTWLHTDYDTDFWASPGGDFEALPSAVTPVGTAGPYVWTSTPGMVADVQAWLDAPASNHGWILIGAEGAATTAKRFASREESLEALRPQLVIEYQLACDGAGMRSGAYGLCHAYCEALDCDGPWPLASDRACDRIASNFARLSGGAPLPCESFEAAQDSLLGD